MEQDKAHYDALQVRSVHKPVDISAELRSAGVDSKKIQDTFTPSEEIRCTMDATCPLHCHHEVR